MDCQLFAVDQQMYVMFHPQDYQPKCTQLARCVADNEKNEKNIEILLISSKQLATKIDCAVNTTSLPVKLS